MSVLVVVASVTLAVLALVGWVVSVADSAPNLTQLKPQVQGQLSQVFAANGQSLGYIQSDNLRTPVTSRQIPADPPRGDGRDRGPPLLPARRARLHRHHPRGIQGPVQRGRRAPGRLDADDAAGPQPVSAARDPEPALQDRSGEARRAAVQAPRSRVDPVQLSQRRPVRDRRRPDRIRRRRGVADVLQQAGVEARPGAGGAARRDAAGAVRLQPVHSPRARAPAPPRRAAGDGRIALHHPGAGRHGRGVAASGGPERLVQHPSGSRTCSTTSSSS